MSATKTRRIEWTAQCTCGWSLGYWFRRHDKPYREAKRHQATHPLNPWLNWNKVPRPPLTTTPSREIEG